METLSTVASIFILLLAGYGARRIGVLKTGDSTVVNSIIINLTMPAFIFVNTHGRVLTADMVKAPVVSIVLELIILGLAYASARAMKLDRRTTAALMLVSAFGNTGFLGYPVVHAAFTGHPDAELTAVMIDQFAMSMILCSVGVAVAATFAGSQFEWRSLLEFFKTPLFPSTIVALLFKDVQVPRVIMDTLDFMAKGTVPLAMISIGLNLGTTSVRQYPAALVVGTILKMVLAPLLMALALPLIGVAGTVRQVTILETAMPAAVFTGVVAARYGANGAFAAGAIFLMTLLSVVLIPAVLMLVR